MQVHVPDPDYTSSERARASFRLAFKLALAFVAIIWLIDIANWALGLELGRFGIRPREIAGLPGILFAPLLHGGPFHLAANSVPLLVLGDPARVGLGKHLGGGEGRAADLDDARDRDLSERERVHVSLLA